MDEGPKDDEERRTIRGQHDASESKVLQVEKEVLERQRQANEEEVANAERETKDKK